MDGEGVGTSLCSKERWGLRRYVRRKGTGMKRKREMRNVAPANTPSPSGLQTPDNTSTTVGEEPCALIRERDSHFLFARLVEIFPEQPRPYEELLHGLRAYHLVRNQEGHQREPQVHGNTHHLHSSSAAAATSPAPILHFRAVRMRARKRLRMRMMHQEDDWRKENYMREQSAGIGGPPLEKRGGGRIWWEKTKIVEDSIRSD